MYRNLLLLAAFTMTLAAEAQTPQGSKRSGDKTYEKRVLVEEFTGTRCGNCTRGIAGMIKMREAYGDRFVGVSLHQFKQKPADPMYITDYYEIGWEYAPSAMLERSGTIIDPYYGSYEGENILYDCDKVLNQTAQAGVWVEGRWNQDYTQVEATAYVEGQADNATYQVAFVLIADSVTGSGAGWTQSNFLAYYPGYNKPEDLAKFYKGGEYGQAELEWAFDDVTIASSYIGGNNQAPSISNLAAYTQGQSSFTLSLPTSKTDLMNAIHTDKIAVIALVFDSNGTLLNSVKNYNISPATGIENTNNNGIENVTEVARYNAAGQRIDGPQKGINIVKYANGTSKKVLVR